MPADRYRGHAASLKFNERSIEKTRAGGVGGGRERAIARIPEDIVGETGEHMGRARGASRRP